METPDPPHDTPGALKQVVLIPHDMPWRLRVGEITHLLTFDPNKPVPGVHPNWISTLAGTSIPG